MRPMSRARVSLASLFAVTLSLAACSGAGPDVGASGGAASGGAASGGNASGGAASGGATSGGNASGGETASGGNASGGETASGGNASGGDGSGGELGSGGGSTVFQLTSPEWDVIDNEECTKDNTPVCAVYPEESTNLSTTGTKNRSPEMSFEGVPEGTQSFAVVLGDLSNGMAHWVIWDIPADATTLEAGLAGTATLTEPDGARQASAVGSGYFGSGKCGNVYEHRVYALKIPTLTPAPTSASAARTAIMALGDDILGESFARLQSRDYCTP